MKPIEERLPEMLRKYDAYWDSDEHDIDLASWLVNCVPPLIIYIHQLRGALGYSVPGHIKENPDILNGIADALAKENERLKEGWEVIARLPMSEHPSDTRAFAKRMLKGETPYKLNE